MPSGYAEVILAKEALRDIAVLIKHVDHIHQIADYPNELEPDSNALAIATYIAKRISIPVADAARLLRAIRNLNRLRVQLHLNEKQTVELITASLENQGADKDLIETWKSTSPKMADALKAMSSNHPLGVAQKAAYLATLHQNVFTSVSVITDIRPVFNEEGDKILQGILTHELVIDYYDGNRSQRIAFSLDASDMAELTRACQRAVKKTTVAKASLQGLPWPTVVIREKEEDE
jgi:hypothetical protein